MAIDWDAEILDPVMAVFGEGDPAIDATLPLYTQSGNAPFRLKGAVFDSAYRKVTDLASGDVATSTSPVLGVRASLFVVPPRVNDVVWIPSAGMNFGVVDVEPDGHGHILLILMEAA